MKEIGGYFEFERLTGREYYPELLALNTARNALLYVLKARQISKLYIPYFLCDSVAKMCARNGFEYEYYRIDGDFLPVFEKSLGEHEYLYIVNFYGQVSDEAVRLLQRKYRNIILDNVQDFFRKPLAGVDTIYSCRKFFGVPDGAYLSCGVSLAEEIPVDKSGERMRHLVGRLEGNASDYYGDFKSNDGSFGQLELMWMSALTHNILGAIDYNKVRNTRNSNFTRLAEAFDRHNQLALVPPDGPYCYPLCCNNGMEIKKRLAAEKIYIPTLWPNVLEMEGTLEQKLARNILPLPCDQRYGQADMERMIVEVMKCID